FPAKLSEACRHEIDHCNKCLTQHIKSTLDGHLASNEAVTNDIRCPSKGCGRRLLTDEINLYADAATAGKYTRQVHLESLQNAPNFRWCMRDGCPNGDVYSLTSTMITCTECRFKMCFRHEMEWHEGYTCDQYDKSGADT
ncbi:hypothetical protein B0T17DRAFT_477628, partial [Bombardia bombarda]